MIDLTEEQKRAYARFITARNKVGLVRVKGFGKTPWIPQRDCLSTVDIVGLNHPLFEQNDDWLEYKEASLAWWKIEPEFRHEQRMRATRGDYGVQDNWDEVSVRGRDVCSLINGDE